MSVTAHDTASNGHSDRRREVRNGRSIRNSSRNKTSKYAPSVDPNLPQIPPIADFKLHNIVQGHNQDETAQVVDSVLNVTRNFQRDLRDEIRKKLSIEQRIQYKNIELSKLVQAVKKASLAESQRNFEAIDTSKMQQEVESLVTSASETSQKARSLISTVKTLQSKSSKYSVSENKYPNLHRLLNSETKSTHISTNDKRSDNQQESQDKPIGNETREFPLPEANQNNGPIPRDSPSPSPSDMSAESFEQFLSSSIAKYRERQRNRQRANELINNELDELNNLREASSLSINPVKLLYSSILETDSGNTTFGIKSAATSASTFQTSHFKKLRINGSPITSATYKNMTVKPKCDCESSDESPAKAALESLSISDADAGHNVEYTSSDVISESSDDVSSSSDDFASPTTMNTNQYYLNLKSDLRRKRSKQSLRNRASTRSFIRESTSPTPRHKPSHRTLKPKNSILKTKSKPQKTMKRVPRRSMGPLLPPHNDEGIISLNTDTVQGTILQLEPETSDDENEVRTYRGIDDTDDHSSRSIERLREYLIMEEGIIDSSTH
ncbi:hypothetical protein JA9_001375 [Meyerozyma sp. JA9]|nr:hypothetical protein JA9_001375 [Meyerozyma sp. JA9]